MVILKSLKKDAVRNFLKIAIKEVAISYVDTPEDMKVWTEKIKEINPDIKVLTRVTSPIISTHAGSGAYAVFYTMEEY